MFVVKVSNLLKHTSILKQALFHSSHLPLASHFTYLFCKIKSLNTLSLEKIKVH